VRVSLPEGHPIGIAGTGDTNRAASVIGGRVTPGASPAVAVDHFAETPERHREYALPRPKIT
jgi:hypothetical protein